MKRPRDSQRQRVYDWEMEYVWSQESTKSWLTHTPLLSMDECRALVTRVWNDHDISLPVPKVKSGIGRDASGCKERIILPEHDRFPEIVLHETTHAILDAWQIFDAWHGCSFMVLYIELLVRYANCDYNHLKKTARDCKIKTTLLHT